MRRRTTAKPHTYQILFGTGDALAQHAVEKRGFARHDFGRTSRMLLYGGGTPSPPRSAHSQLTRPAVFGPAATLWFGFLQRRVVIPGRPNLEIVAKVLADQCVFASTNLALFLSSMAYMEGADPAERLATSYLPGLAKNWMVWPPVQLVNFKFVPLEMRVLVVNVVALGWNCYLSWLNSQGTAGKDKVTEYPPDA